MKAEIQSKTDEYPHSMMKKIYINVSPNISIAELNEICSRENVSVERYREDGQTKFRLVLFEMTVEKQNK